MKLSLIIPAYNEETRLPPFLTSISQYHAAHPDHIYEVIIVDDGSSDSTQTKAESFSGSLPNFKLIRLPQNQGKGAAIRAGVTQASGTHIVFMDADGATEVTELPSMIAALQEADIAIGNRWLPDSQVHRSSPLRHLSGWVNKTYMSLFGLGEIDTMCGFKGYRTDIAKKLFSNLLENRWLFDTEIAYKAVRERYSIKNFPIRWESKDGSKLDTKTLLKSALAIWPLIKKINKQYDTRQIS